MSIPISIKATGTPAQRAQRLTLAAEAAQRRADRAKAYFKKVRATYKAVKKEAKSLIKEAKKALKEAKALKKSAPAVDVPKIESTVKIRRVSLARQNNASKAKRRVKKPSTPRVAAAGPDASLPVVALAP